MTSEQEAAANEDVRPAVSAPSPVVTVTIEPFVDWLRNSYRRVLIRAPLDWEYLIRGAHHGIHRVASLLLYARSAGIPVPSSVAHQLVEEADACR